LKNKKGSIYLTLFIVALVLALIFINTTQNRVLNKEGDESIKTDQVTYSFSEEMTAYASDAATTATTSALYINALKGFGDRMRECYSNKLPVDFEKIKAILEEECEQAIALALASSSGTAGDDTEEIDFADVEQCIVQLEEFELTYGEFDCGFAFTFEMTDDSSASSSSTSSSSALTATVDPEQNSWAKMLRSIIQYTATETLAVSICGSMRGVLYTNKSDDVMECPALDEATVDNFITNTTKKLNDIMDASECGDVECTADVLCKFVDPMGCHWTHVECVPPPHMTGEACDCYPEDPVGSGLCPGDMACCVEDYPETDEVACVGPSAPPDEMCEVLGAPGGGPVNRTEEECPAGTIDILEANDCDISKAAIEINGSGAGILLERTIPTGPWIDCESGSTDEGEVILLINWSCIDTDPDNCLHVEGTDEDDQCKDLETSFLQSIYLYQGATAMSPPTPECDIPPVGCIVACACFPAGTLIDMADGSQKAIEDVLVGDLIKSYDVESGTIITSEVEETDSRVGSLLVVLSFDNGKVLETTTDHPLYVKKSDGSIGWASLDADKSPDRIALEVGDLVMQNDLSWTVITKIDQVEGQVQLYNLRKTAHSNFYADGFLVHNKAAPGPTPPSPPATSGPTSPPG